MNYNDINLYSTKRTVEAVWALLVDTPYVRDPWKGPIKKGREFGCKLRVAASATQLCIDEIMAVLNSTRERGVIEMILEEEQWQWSYAVQISRDGMAKELPTEPTFDCDDVHADALNLGGFWSALNRQNQWAREELDSISRLTNSPRLQIVKSLNFDPKTVTKH